eukprot:c8667_g1_i1.p2 GENE.c8667_g1_i1~~c8667_g1_i1.p2  ORF type:complete len:358 (-),score=94.03 c8667_g1_i1:64-1137(-)
MGPDFFKSASAMKLLAVLPLLVACLAVAALARSPAPAFCQDPPTLKFCAVLPGQGAPLPPPIANTDTVQVWVLQAPVWEFIPHLGNITKELKLIHTAIGLVNEDTGAEYSFEFEGIFESPNATFPYIVANASVPGGQEAIWCNAGGVCWDAGIDWDYYTVFKSQVATMSGSTFNQLMQWLPVDNETYSTTYETFAVWDEWANGKGNMYLNSYTCDDFAWRVMGLLAGWGVEFENTTLFRVFLNFYVTKPPIAVDIKDPAVYAQVVDSFASFNIMGRAAECAAIVNDSLKKDLCEAGVAEQLFVFLETSKYMLINGTYYYLEQTMAGFDWKYAPWPITPITISDEEVKAKLGPEGFRR